MTNWSEIIHECRNGSQKAMTEAYRLCWPAIYPAVYRILRNREEAEDIMQESFIHGFDKLRELKDPQKYPAWQKQVSLRSALNRLRQLRPMITVDENEHDTTEDDDGQEWSDVSKEVVDRCIAELPEGYRLIVTLHLLEGMTHEDIARSLGIQPGTSRSQYMRALARLRKNIRYA